MITLVAEFLFGLIFIRALVLYFRKDWVQLLSGALAARGRLSDPQGRLFWLIVCGTVPARVSVSRVRSLDRRLVSSPTRCSPKNFIGSERSVP